MFLHGDALNEILFYFASEKRADIMDYVINNCDLKLIDSYKVSKCDFKKELKAIHEETPSYEIWNRGINQMCLEWASHNAAYACGIARERTKDCDLDYPQSFLERAFYAVCGCLVWLFIK